LGEYNHPHPTSNFEGPSPCPPPQIFRAGLPVEVIAKYRHGTTEYRGIFSRYLPWRTIGGTAQH